MATIVAGFLIVKDGYRSSFIEQSRAAILAARAIEECVNFSVSPDSIDPNRVNVFEKWSSYAALQSFRGSGPENDAFSLVETFDVQEYNVDS